MSKTIPYYLGEMDEMEMRILLLDTVREENPKVLMELRKEGGAGAVDRFVEEQIRAAKELEQTMVQNEAMAKSGGLGELVKERLLDYPGKPMEMEDPFLVDREQIRLDNSLLANLPLTSDMSD